MLRRLVHREANFMDGVAAFRAGAPDERRDLVLAVRECDRAGAWPDALISQQESGAAERRRKAGDQLSTILRRAKTEQRMHQHQVERARWRIAQQVAVPAFDREAH